MKMREKKHLKRDSDHTDFKQRLKSFCEYRLAMTQKSIDIYKEVLRRYGIDYSKVFDD